MSQETEQAVIGAILINPTILDEVAEILSQFDFTNPINGQIFSAMLAVAKAGKVIDPIEISEHLGEQRLQMIGGMNTLTEILITTPSAANGVAYARYVKDVSNKNNLLSAMQDAADIVKNAKGYDDALTGVSSLLSKLDPETGGYKTFDQLIKERLHELDRRHQNNGAIEGVTTGLSEVDNRLLGLNPGDLWVIGARPAMGKTALGLNISEHVLRNHGPVLFFSCEMTKEQLVDRYFSSVGRVDGKKIRSAKLDADDWSRLAAGVPTLKGLPMHIIDEPSIDVNRALTIARKYNRKSPLKMIVVDYLQLMRFEKLNGYECVTEVSRCLKNMAKLIGCPVIALAQLNRSVEARIADKRPNPSDLRSSGQIEQDADVISFIYREEVYNKETMDKGIAELITAKSRNGECGTDLLSCDMSTFRFSDLRRDYRPAPPVSSYTPFSH